MTSHVLSAIHIGMDRLADTNAAKNILAAGHAVLACGEADVFGFCEAGTSGNRISNLVPALPIGLAFL